MELARPRCVVKKFAIGPDMRIAGDFALEGQDVAAHLAGCTELYLFAATVGADAEREISRLFAAGKANDALLLDSAATCAVESYADEICEDLQAGETFALTERFSCGYGDFPLSAPAEDPAASFRRHQDRPVLGRKFSLVPAEIGDGAHRRDKAKRARKKTRVRQ